MLLRGLLSFIVAACALVRAAEDPSASAQCAALMRQGDFYRKQGRLADAVPLFERAAGLARESEKENPGLYAEVLNRIGAFYLEIGRSAEARDAATDAIARLEKLPLPVAEAAFAWNTRGMAQMNLGSHNQAEESLRQAIELSTRAHGEEHPETASYQTNLALALMARNQSERANSLLQRARVTIEKSLGESSVALGVVYAELCAAATARNKLATAEEYGAKAVAIYRQQPQPDVRSVALAEVNLADVYLKGHRLDDANRVLPNAVAKERTVAANSRMLADGVQRLAQLRSMQHSWREAGALYRESIGIYERTLGPADPVLKPVLLAYAEVLRHDSASKTELKTLESRARRIGNSQPRS